MSLTYQELKKKDVIDVCSGKRLGRVRDLTFTFPDGRVKSFSAGGAFCQDVVTIPFSKVERIGEDAVLVNLSAREPEPPKRPCPSPCAPPREHRHDACPPVRNGKREEELKRELSSFDGYGFEYRNKKRPFITHK